MLPLIILLMVSKSIAENCSYIYDNQSYKRATLLTTKGLPTNLVYNPNNKDLLFTLIDIDTLHNDDTQTLMDQYILRKDEAIKIDNINGQAAAVDIKNNKVYIATDKGLNVLNDTTASFIGLKHKDIVQLFKPKHRDEIYAVLFPENEVYLVDIEKNEKKKVADIPCAFFLAVDTDENIFYECDSKYVKVLLNGFHEPIEFAGIPKNSARAIAVDNKNRVILATNDGLYHLHADNVIPSKLMDLDFVPSGIAFDDDDIYLSSTGIIYKYTNDECE